MFESIVSGGMMSVVLPEPGSVVVDDGVLGWMTAVLSRTEPVDAASASGLIDTMRAVEGVKDAASGFQAAVMVAFDAVMRADREARGIRAERRGRGLASQVGLARRESRFRARGHLQAAVMAHRELPWSFGVLRAGRISEWRLMVIVAETACLPLEARQVIDQELAGTPEAVAELEGMSDRQTAAWIRARAAELDPAAVVAHRRRVEGERRVTARPAPDLMLYLTALLPVRDGVAVIAALERAADSLKAQGDPRSRSQIKADLVVERVTGRNPVTHPVPVTLNVVISDRALFSETHAGGHLDGYGPVPASLVREFAGEVGVQLRRLYANPRTGALVAMESAARLFPPALARLVKLRDQTCRTPWCDAPIRHIDHVIPHAGGGPTTVENAQGLCQACNHAKQGDGWTSVTVPSPRTGRHTVVTTTPTGHTYTSTAPRIAC